MIEGRDLTGASTTIQRGHSLAPRRHLIVHALGLKPLVAQKNLGNLYRKKIEIAVYHIFEQ